MRHGRLFLFLCLACFGLLVGAARTAGATVVRALSLTELVTRSDAVVVAEPTRWSSQWVTLGGQRRMVTDTRLRISRRVFGVATTVNEITVRTLGGRIGDLGQLVHGEASFGRGQAALVFLRRLGETRYRVTGMAQGHLPLGADAKGTIRLRPAPSGALLLGGSPGPGHLVGMELEHFIARILEVRGRG